MHENQRGVGWIVTAGEVSARPRASLDSKSMVVPRRMGAYLEGVLTASYAMVVNAKARLSKAVILAAVVLFGLGCGELLGSSSDQEDESPNNQVSELPPVDSVGVRPDTLDISVGGSTRMTLYVRDATGTVLEPDEYEVRWSTDNEHIVTVDDDGQIHAIAPGITRVNAFVRGEKGWAEVRVGRLVDRIEIVEPERPLVPGESTELEARVWSEGDVRMDDASVVWSLVATDTAIMQEGGRLRALRPGYVTVTAMHGGVAGRETFSISDYDIRGIRVEHLPERMATGESVEVAPVAIGPEDFPMPHVSVQLRAISDNIEVTDDTTVHAKSAGWARLVVQSWDHVEEREILVYEPFVELDAGRTHACAIDAVGRAFCWGANTYGEVGSQVEDAVGRPLLVSETLRFEMISAGSFHTCGVTHDANLYCWGANREGKLGDGTNTDRWQPTRVLGNIEWASVSAGSSHTCGLSVAGDAYCWGSNKIGARLGTGRIGDEWTPQPVAGDHVFSSISAGLDHSCAIEAFTNRAWCWGNNEHLQLGLDASLTTTDDGNQISRVPLLVSGDTRFRRVFASLADSFSCGIGLDGEVACWGNNRHGALLEGGSDYPVSEERDPLETSRPVPIHDEPTEYQALDVGAHACGVREGDIRCWVDGFHTVQVHPYLPPPKQFSARKLESLIDFESVSAGQKFTCGISERGEVHCAGADYQRFAESQGFSPSTYRLYRLLRPDLPEYEDR